MKTLIQRKIVFVLKENILNNAADILMNFQWVFKAVGLSPWPLDFISTELFLSSFILSIEHSVSLVNFMVNLSRGSCLAPRQRRHRNKAFLTQSVTLMGVMYHSPGSVSAGKLIINLLQQKASELSTKDFIFLFCFCFAFLV